MDINEEALACLTAATEESEKTSNVDITLMLRNCENCARLVESLKVLNTSAERSPGLEELATTLAYHQEILSAKISQLDGSVPNHNQPTHTHTITQPISSAEGGSSPSEARSRKHSKRQLAIEDTIVPKGQSGFSAVAGLQEAKQSLTEAIILPLLHPHLFTGGRKPWRRVLLYGPPGTGKSRLAQALSAEIQSTFYCVSSTDLVSSWVGESEKLVKELFTHATSQPGTSVVFIDEVDSLCRQRSIREEEHTRRIKTELLTQMEGATASASTNSLFLLCATNCPWELDTAFLRRFQKRIYIPLPDRESRLSLMHIHTNDSSVKLSGQQWAELAHRTEGYSGSDIANMVLGALFEPIRHMQQATHWIHTPSGHLIPCSEQKFGSLQARLVDLPPDKVQPREVCMEDFLASLHTHTSTVSAEELTKFQQFTNSYGQLG